MISRITHFITLPLEINLCNAQKAIPLNKQYLSLFKKESERGVYHSTLNKL